MNGLQMFSTDCYDFQEHSGWRSNPDKTIGVTWDGWCSGCGFRIENARFDSGKGLGIHGDGRTLAACIIWRIIDGEGFTGDRSKIYCSKCVPRLLGNLLERQPERPVSPAGSIVPPQTMLHGPADAPPFFMKTLILNNHILTLTHNGSLEIDSTQHATRGKSTDREDTKITTFSEEEVEDLKNFLRGL